MDDKTAQPNQSQPAQNTPPAPEEVKPAEQPTTSTPAPTPEPAPQTPATPTPAEQTQPTPTATTTPNATTSTSPAPGTPPAGTPPPAKPEQHMEKRVSLRTTLLILVLAILAGVLLFIALRPTQKHPTLTSSVPTPTTKPSVSHTILGMTLESSASASPTQLSTKTVDVTVDSQQNTLNGVQFEISYDPTVLSNVTVTQGDFFPNPLILLNSVDSKNGKINYAIGIQPTGKGIQGSGTVAKISYTMLPTATAAATKLTFLPKTQAVQEGTLGSVLEKAMDLVLPTESLTPSVKTTFTAQ